jgi:hypothetical protein
MEAVSTSEMSDIICDTNSAVSQDTVVFILTSAKTLDVSKQ